jgi:hypothetical protein
MKINIYFFIDIIYNFKNLFYLEFAIKTITEFAKNFFFFFFYEYHLKFFKSLFI